MNSHRHHSPSRCWGLCQTTSILWFVMVATTVVGPSFLSTFPAVAMAQGLTCEEGEVPLIFGISHTLKEGFQDLYLQIQGRRYRLPEDPDLTYDQFNYYSDVPVDDGGDSISNATAICVPANECLTATVTVFALLPYWEENRRYDFSAQDFTMEYNGTLVDEPMGPFPYTGEGVYFVAELGNCEVVCDAESEVLLEIEGVTSDIANYDWQVLDAVSGESIQHCAEPVYYWNSTSYIARCYWEGSNYYHEKICLPRNGCFMVLAGESYLQEYVTSNPSTFVVTYDGRQVSLIENIQFEAIFLQVDGASCQSLSCGAEDHLLEMFLFRNDVDREENPVMKWSLSNAGERKEVSAVGNVGMGLIEYGMRPLQYHRECIPKKGSCVRFDLSVPPTFEVYSQNGDPFNNGAQNYYESGDYRIVIDGVIYGDETYSFGGYEGDENAPVFELTQYVGDCTASKACNFGESLLVVDMQTGPRSPQWNYYDVTWSFYQYAKNGALWLPLAVVYGGVLPDERYRYLSCYSPDEWPYTQEASCTEFALNENGVENGNIAGFMVSVDGTSFTQYEECDADYCQGYVILPVGGDCSDPLSTGAIAGIAVGAAAIVFGLAAYYRYRTQARTSSATATTTGTTTPTPPRGEAVAVPVQMAPTPKAVVTDSASHGNAQQEDGTPVTDDAAEEEA